MRNKRPQLYIICLGVYALVVAIIMAFNRNINYNENQSLILPIIFAVIALLIVLIMRFDIIISNKLYIKNMKEFDYYLEKNELDKAKIILKRNDKFAIALINSIFSMDFKYYPYIYKLRDEYHFRYYIKSKQYKECLNYNNKIMRHVKDRNLYNNFLLQIMIGETNLIENTLKLYSKSKHKTDHSYKNALIIYKFYKQGLYVEEITQPTQLEIDVINKLQTNLVK